MVNRKFMLTLCASMCAFGFTIEAAAQRDMSLGRTRNAVERMRPERLAVVAEQVAANKAKRIAQEDLPYQPALNDYRAIFHSHAGDSAHTGGTREEMFEAAKESGLDVVFLGDHFRPPRDYMENWRGMREGVLYIPGSEMHGFLLHPENSIMEAMDVDSKDAAAIAEFIPKVTEGSGMIFLSHAEDRIDHPMDGLTGMEVYNRHADAKNDMNVVFFLFQAATSPSAGAELQASIDAYPDAIFAAQCEYPELYMAKWDREAANQKVVGVAANDCHHNQVFVVKMKDAETGLVGTIVDDDDGMRPVTTKASPGLTELFEGHQPGDIVAKFDFDPYPVSFRNVTTHILAEEQTEESIRAAVAAGHCYVAHEWMSESDGFYVHVKREGKSVAIMGDDIELAEGDVLAAQFPVPCIIRVVKDGEELMRSEGNTLEHTLTEPGVYRVEGWFALDEEERPWLYGNPVYVR